MDLSDHVIFPYIEELVSLDAFPGMAKWLWICRTALGNRATFSQGTYFSEGRPWWEWHQLALQRLQQPLSIVLARLRLTITSSLDRGGKVFNQTAPVVKLRSDATEDQHLELLGLLNSSTACFWLKQICFPKGGDTVGTGRRPFRPALGMCTLRV